MFRFRRALTLVAVAALAAPALPAIAAVPSVTITRSAASIYGERVLTLTGQVSGVLSPTSVRLQMWNGSSWVTKRNALLNRSTGQYRTTHRVTNAQGAFRFRTQALVNSLVKATSPATTATWQWRASDCAGGIVADSTVGTTANSAYLQGRMTNRTGFVLDTAGEVDVGVDGTDSDGQHVRLIATIPYRLAAPGAAFAGYRGSPTTMKDPNQVWDELEAYGWGQFQSAKAESFCNMRTVYIYHRLRQA